MHEQTAVAAPKPLLRGWAHLVSFPVWMAVGVALVAVANVAASGRLLLAIYVLGTGTMFGVAFVSLDGWVRVAVLATAWLGAVVGIVLHWLPRVPKVWRGASYMIVSWAAVLVFPQLAHGLGAVGFALVLAGGACYTIGAVSLATQWPNPWPRVFGFHEVFHAFTVVAAALQFVAITYAVVPQL